MLCRTRGTEIILTSKLITSGVTSGVTLAEAKGWLKVESDDEDTLIQALIDTAFMQVSQYTGRTFQAGAWETEFDYFPSKLKLDVMPIDITSIVVSYSDENDVDQVLDASEYFVRDPGPDDFATIDFNGTMPNLYNKENAVVVAYDAGYDSLPAPVKTAILMQVATMFENRQTEIIGASTTEITNGARSLLFPYKML